MLRTIREVGEAEFVPSLAVLVGVLLALLGVAVLIYFVRHIAVTLQASEIMARITRDTRRVVALDAAARPGERAQSGAMRRSRESPPGPDGVTA